MHGAEIVPEVAAVKMADRWHTPVWVIWEECSEQWQKWVAAYDAEIELARQHQSGESVTLGNLDG